MLLAARLVSNLVYAFEDTVLSYVICNVVEPCPKTNNIFEIYDVPALGNYGMNYH
jgi:hypothetical protein